MIYDRYRNNTKSVQSYLAVQSFARWRHSFQLQNGELPSDEAQCILALVQTDAGKDHTEKRCKNKIIVDKLSERLQN